MSSFVKDQQCPKEPEAEIILIAGLASWAYASCVATQGPTLEGFHTWFYLLLLPS